MTRILTRRKFLTVGTTCATGMVLTGCDSLGSNASFNDIVLSSGEWLSYKVHRLIGSGALAREYDPSDMSPNFRTNGSTKPRDEEYARHAAQGFANWKLDVRGLVEAPKQYTLAELQAMPSRTQITRHDCVEGWSAIGKWTGVPMSQILNEVKLKQQARFIVLHCADDYNGTPYYESIDLADAFHPQTILAYGMNDAPLPMGHGAPVRMRLERQLGYKHAKFVMRLEAVTSLDSIYRGNGGFWEDTGNYEWYAGI